MTDNVEPPAPGWWQGPDGGWHPPAAQPEKPAIVEDVAPAPAPPAPVPWYRKMLLGGIPVWAAIILGVALAVGLVVRAATKEDEDDTPSRKLTLCEAIGESKAALRPSDYRRLAGYTQAQMEAVVYANCPELAFYILDD